MQTETERVAHHIHRAEAVAAGRDVSTLTRLQRIVRRLLLRELTRYREASRFPKNGSFTILTPYFIDASGTRCAMAHLLELGGERELVARIASERNNAYVRELADEPRLLAWLQAAGFTVAEAAAIHSAPSTIRCRRAACSRAPCSRTGWRRSTGSTARPSASRSDRRSRSRTRTPPAPTSWRRSTRR
jgi:hypothetical protein